MAHGFGAPARLILIGLVIGLVPSAGLSVRAAGLPIKAKSTRPSAVSDKDLKQLAELDKNYQKQSSEMNVAKITKIPLMDQERHAAGRLYISAGNVRMELEGAEKTLLIVNKKNLWAVTYPDAAFKDAAVQVIQTSTGSKKSRTQNFVALLGQGGFLKFFMATGVQKQDNGDVLYFLAPREEQDDFKRAEVVVSADGKKLVMLSYWDNRDNETRLDFSDVKMGLKLDKKLFDYTPPANADVMRI